MLTQTRVKGLLATSPELAYELICKITTRACTATHTVRSMALLDAYCRLVQVLQEIAEPAATEGELKGQQKIPARTTHAQLAQRIGTSARWSANCYATWKKAATCAAMDA